MTTIDHTLGVVLSQRHAQGSANHPSSQARSHGSPDNTTAKAIRRCSMVLLSFVCLITSLNTGAASIIFTDQYEFNSFGTVSGDDHIYIGSPTFTPIGNLSMFDPSLGTLTGVNVYASLVGNYAILSHCHGIFCDFRTYGTFSDSFYSSPPGANFSNNGYVMSVELTPASDCILDCTASETRHTHHSEQVIIDPEYFYDYIGPPGATVNFVRQGDAYPNARIFHESPFGGTGVIFEICIENCVDELALPSLIAYLAQQTHTAFYNDTHFRFYGRRFFQVDYTYEPHVRAVPAPATLLLFATGLGLIGCRLTRRLPATVIRP